MPARNSKAADQSAIFAVSERLNQLLIHNLDPAIWTAKPPGNVRTIAAIFTHMHNVRTKWIRLNAPHLKVPARLNRAHCTRQQARKALAASAARCEQMLVEIKAGGILQFVRDGWAQPWSASPALLTETLIYMLAHEAHHRGQITMLTHQLGRPLPRLVMSNMWDWKKFWN